jgi:alpha-1,2-mannosyltransferase
VLVALWNRAVHGVWSITGSYTDVVDRATQGVEAVLGDDLLTNYLGFLVSFDRGFLVWTPVLLLFVPALLRARKSLPDWSLWLVLGGLVYTFVQIRMSPFHGGLGYHGYRLGLELLTCLVPALAFTAPSLGRISRRLVPVVIALQFAAFAVGATFESFFIGPDEVWRSNSFWLALRHNPDVLGAWLALTLGAGWAVARRLSVPSDELSRREIRPDLSQQTPSGANRSTS